jgi:hypothetical protein
VARERGVSYPQSMMKNSACSKQPPGSRRHQKVHETSGAVPSKLEPAGAGSLTPTTPGMYAGAATIVPPASEARSPELAKLERLLYGHVSRTSSVLSYLQQLEAETAEFAAQKKNTAMLPATLPLLERIARLRGRLTDELLRVASVVKDLHAPPSVRVQRANIAVVLPSENDRDSDRRANEIQKQLAR